jgi:signal transduction histidine kinase
VFPTDLFEKIIGRTTKEKQKSPIIEREIETPHHGKIYTRISTSPVLDKKNDRIGTVLNIEDITELRRLGEEAQRNRRLRATGEMAAGIAHEIRNPLGSIELFSSLLKKDLSEDPEKKEIVEHISASVKNMDRIISSLLLFAKSPQPSRQSCDLNTLLKDLFKNSSAILIPEKINPIFSLNDNAIANGDSHLLKQVFINLIRNSIQAMPEGGNLEIATQKCSQFEQSSDQSDYYRQFIKVTVTDQGGGISEENLANIFNPFFTTKDHGTGLGLSISHNIIKAHQGTIDVENEMGKGARFILKIPCWDHELDKK